MTQQSPFHAGELDAQKRAGVVDLESRVGGFIRDHMPQQHRDFHTSLPFVVMAAADEAGQPWVTVLEAGDGWDTSTGFIGSPDPRTLTFAARPDPRDPLAKAFETGTDVGMLGIELATRRRNRLSGYVQAAGGGLQLDIRQTFGNCPQYIHEREWYRADRKVPEEAQVSGVLSAVQMQRIGKANTLFIGSGQQGEEGAASNGYDASHRGGEPGFVQVIDAGHLRIPDYAGNNFFNTIGNILQNPRIGLLFIDFATGGMLQISGKASVDWNPVGANDPAARRMIDVTIEAVVDRPAALSLRWRDETEAARRFVIADKVAETPEITSFYLAPVDGKAREVFEPGQHLPIALKIPGAPAKVERTYSLSNTSEDPFYRLSVKREPLGQASRHLHDVLEIGDTIEAGRPSGDFVIPCSACPLVLVSAGVGITPMLSMLHEAASSAQERPVWFVHGARNSAHHAFREEVGRVVSDLANLQQVVHFSNPLSGDQIGADFDTQGRITADSLIALNAGEDAHYMLCGPISFLSDIQTGLIERGVPEDQIHFETFGPSA